MTLCLDTSVWVKLLTDEEGSEVAASAVLASTGLIAPPFLWVELGSVLRKKMRLGLDPALAEEAWTAFLDVRIQTVDSVAVARRAWEIAAELGELTLHDAAFVAAAELAPSGPCDLLTADGRFVRQAEARYPFVRMLVP